MEDVIMDSERFDGLVRSFGQTRSRRQALRTLAGVAAGAVALGGAGEVAARRHHQNKQAHKRGQKRPGAQAQGATPKTMLCHFEAKSNTWNPITVSSKKDRQQHLA